MIVSLRPLSAGGASDTHHVVGGTVIVRAVTVDGTIEDGTTLVHRDPVLAAGVTLTIEGTGELYLL